MIFLKFFLQFITSVDGSYPAGHSSTLPNMKKAIKLAIRESIKKYTRKSLTQNATIFKISFNIFEMLTSIHETFLQIFHQFIGNITKNENVAYSFEPMI